MTDKRPWLSAYNYCQLNPVMRVDPTGMIDIMIEDFSGGGEGDGNGDPPAKTSLPKNAPAAPAQVDQTSVNNFNGKQTIVRQSGTNSTATSSGQTLNDPYQNGHGEKIYTMNQFLTANKGLSRSEIINQRRDRSKTFLGSQSGGPTMRYVINPHDGKVIDMRHMLIVGHQPPAFGNLLEVFQWSIGQESGMDLQDFYSNGVGYQFYMQYNSAQNLFYPSTFTDQLRTFFYSPQRICNW